MVVRSGRQAAGAWTNETAAAGRRRIGWDSDSTFGYSGGLGGVSRLGDVLLFFFFFFFFLNRGCGRLQEAERERC